MKMESKWRRNRLTKRICLPPFSAPWESIPTPPTICRIYQRFIGWKIRRSPFAKCWPEFDHARRKQIGRDGRIKAGKAEGDHAARRRARAGRHAGWQDVVRRLSGWRRVYNRPGARETGIARST